MQFVSLPGNSRAYIWAPRALTGSDLTPREDLLLEIDHDEIVSIQNLNYQALPSQIFDHPHFFSLQEEITLMPCLIDAHVHLALDGEGKRNQLSTWGQEENCWSRIKSDLENLKSCGIGAIRDGGDVRSINLQVARGCWSKNQVPRVIATGEALRKQGSYGAFLGGGFYSLSEMSHRAEQLISRGVDQIKVLLSGIVSFKEYGKVAPPSFSRDELQHLVKMAHQNGRKVMAHASSAEAVELALNAGVDSVEHGYFISEDLLKEMAERQVSWIPTLVPVAIQAREPLKCRWSREELEIISWTCAEHMEKIFLAWELGVPVGMGTDSGASGIKHGVNLIEEMLLYSRAGLSNWEILQSATRVNARVLDFPVTCDVLDINSSPRLIGVNGDPLKDLKALNSVEWFFKFD